MSHPFEVGKDYRNRNGQYVVQAIEGDWMKIRYANGNTLETRVSLQARIWENIQFEEQMSRDEERVRLAREARLEARRRTSRARRPAARTKFDGFEESDFEEKRRGIAWTTRKELGKALAADLNRRAQGGFDAWIVPRQARVHVAHKDQYDTDSRETNAAFFVAVDEAGVTYGLRVGKPDGKVKAGWPWAILVAALAENDQVRRDMRRVMQERELALEVYAEEKSYGRVGQIVVDGELFVWQHETADQEMTRQMDWDELASYLQNVAPINRSDLFWRKHLSPQEAIDLGAGAVGQMVGMFEALLPLYASAGA